MSSPKCRQCGKPMKAQKKMIERFPTPEEWRDHVAMNEWIKLQRAHIMDRFNKGYIDSGELARLGDGIIRQARHRFQKAHPNVVIYTKDSAYYQPRDGTFGYQGNNYFCTQSCGYDWAVRQMKRQDGAAQVLVASEKVKV